MKILFCTLLTMSLWNSSNAQLYLHSDYQQIANQKGVSINKYNVKIEIKEPQKVGGNLGYITLRIDQTNEVLSFPIQYLKETTDIESITQWYTITTARTRNEIYNIVKVQTFTTAILENQYSYCIKLSKYDNNTIELYEHAYFSSSDNRKENQVINHEKEEEKLPVFSNPEVLPEFIGGRDSLKAYVESKCILPDSLKKTYGKVRARFVVKKDGSITNISIVKTNEIGLNKYAVDVITNMPLWKPAKQFGTAVNAYYELDITFDNN